MHFRTNTFSRRRFSLGLVAAPLAAALGVGASVEPTGADGPPPLPRWIADSTAPPFGLTDVFHRNPLAMPIAPFALGEVRLQDGPLKQSVEWNRNYMMRLSVDRLLHTFRLNAGLPSSAQPLGGWEAPNVELRGHFVGHYLSACGLMYAATGDQEIKAKGDQIVSALAVCQKSLGSSGYLSAFPSELFDRLDALKRVWAPFYTLHKIMAGLLDMHTQASNAESLEVLLGLARWVDTWTASKTPEHMQEILDNEFGGMNEVLYNLAGVTRDDRWAVVGDRFTKIKFFNPLAVRKDELRGLHANTHMPEAIGAARRYELSQDPRYRNVAEFFWETVVESRTYATGGSSNKEHWETEPNRLGVELEDSSHHQECCCAYNMMKLSRHLYAWTAQPKYIDYYERNLFNHRLGTIQPETGLTSYFLSMTPGAWKTIATEDHGFWCCNGTALEEFSKLNDTIYFHDDRGVYVNLYVASDLHWEQRGIHLRQTTQFPLEPRTTIVVDGSTSEPWFLNLRIPSWTSHDVAVSINGKPVDGIAAPGSYFSVKRVWKRGDRVELQLPMEMTVEPIPDNPSWKALTYGPLVLAGQFQATGLSDELLHKNQGPEVAESPLKVPLIEGDNTVLLAKIKPAAGPLTFSLETDGEAVTLKPLYQSWERFAVYWKSV
jgi:DUF1680 family protein